MDGKLLLELFVFEVVALFGSLVGLGIFVVLVMLLASELRGEKLSCQLQVPIPTELVVVVIVVVFFILAFNVVVVGWLISIYKKIFPTFLLFFFDTKEMSYYLIKSRLGQFNELHKIYIFVANNNLR